MKSCKCGRDNQQFYKGNTSECKECIKNRMRKCRRDPLIGERIREYDRRRFQEPMRNAWAIANQRIRRAKNPEKYRATNAVNNAIRDGRLARGHCEICGEIGQAHHGDYSKPLEVRWFCFRHHRELMHGQIVDYKGNS